MNLAEHISVCELASPMCSEVVYVNIIEKQCILNICHWNTVTSESRIFQNDSILLL